MTTISIGLIGLGRFAALHGRIWRQLPHVRVAAICDRDPQRFEAFKEWFPEANSYTDWQEMLSREKLDAVDVLTPEHLHAEPVLASLQAGAHVFVEKPLAHTPEEAMRLVHAAASYDRHLMVGHVLRFDARYAAVKSELEEGRYGPIRSIYAKRNNGKRFFPIYNRIHPVFILGIHDIDLMHWYMEDRVREVMAIGTNGTEDTGAPTDLSWAMLTFRHGGIGILENHWLLPDGAPSFADIRMEIAASHGSLVIQEPDYGVLRTDNAKTEGLSLHNGFDLHGQTRGPLAAELEHFIECVKTGTPSNLLRPLDALHAVQVAWAIQESAKLGKSVRLEPLEGPVPGP
ncbi:Gfo/Idh/MocA family oxidoreductase [Paenibacillus aurantius]|uniref:Gfo/Idh/MocA family oxidoreductase n=1 Tax=Paenibacillus aurantius TaxID=2918900 RepID=A0AA96LHU7_9BACL|nr:Gfo/Idh/MocA family oxidoreductase [Paenibacillus aurantius]WNQ13263.1 Gfo/Idh/MocA family oxidoreductase [Paenibacillus aurantius]